MSVVHCSQGHQNPTNSRFCHLCGEKLGGEKLVATGAGMGMGTILGDRYRLQREIGHGGFGRTYLAEDINRFNELCVLKEFAPQVRGTYALQKSEELFEREAGVLYKLNHPQIPRFRELFRATFENQGHLFLVQDYVAGQTYRQLLASRQLKGQCFIEAEVLQLLTQLLPVLHYIHGVGVIHRDIAPDNLILRDTDQLPVLIDFGGVKQVAAAAAFQYLESGQSLPVATRLGKIGYAPVEQMQMGRVFPQSDLYALAATLLVLLTGREPQELLDEMAPSPPWKRLVILSPLLTSILERMLAPQPGDRYPSAAAVMQVLQDHSVGIELPTPPAPLSYTPPSFPVTQPSVPRPPVCNTVETVVKTAAISPPPSPRPAKVKRKQSGVGGVLLSLVVLGAVGGVVWWTRDIWAALLIDNLAGGQVTNPGVIDSTSSSDEQARKAALRDRRQALEINSNVLIALTDHTFNHRYPELQGRTLTTGSEDTEWRVRWDAIASEWLDILEQLTPEARRQLGTYGSANRETWKQAVNALYVSSQALNDLTDARFFNLFPEQRQEAEFLSQPIGQVWHAIANDQVKSLQAGTTLEQIQFAQGQFSHQVSGNLAPGDGKVYIANLSEGQIMRLNLQVPKNSALVSIYIPRPTQNTPFYLEDSRAVTWSGTLTQSGFYEIVVVSTATEPIRYTLNLAVDNVTSTPIEPNTPESPDAKN